MVLFKRFLSTLFFKKRIVYSIESENFYRLNFPDLDNALSIRFFKAIPENKLAFITELKPLLSKRRLNSLAAKFAEKANRTFIIAYYGGQVAGCYWYVTSDYDTLVDSFLLEKEDVLLGGAYVAQSYRGKGIFLQMKKHAAQHIRANCMYKRKIISIVEASNRSSIKANQRLGLTDFTFNYVYKCFGINVLSIKHHNEYKASFVLLHDIKNRLLP